jgi:hypothetical protein
MPASAVLKAERRRQATSVYLFDDLVGASGHNATGHRMVERFSGLTLAPSNHAYFIAADVFS